MSFMWTKAQSRAAQAEGWDLFKIAGYYVIQKYDESDRFPNDLSALVYVKSISDKDFDGLHRAAINLNGRCAPTETMGTTQEAFASTIGKDGEDTIEVKVKTIRVLCEMATRLSAVERALNMTPKDQDILDELEQWGD